MSAVPNVAEEYSDLVIVDSSRELQKTINWINSAPTEQDLKESSLLKKLIRFNQRYVYNDREGNMNFEGSKKDT